MELPAIVCMTLVPIINSANRRLKREQTVPEHAEGLGSNH